MRAMAAFMSGMDLTMSSFCAGQELEILVQYLVFGLGGKIEAVALAHAVELVRPVRCTRPSSSPVSFCRIAASASMSFSSMPSSWPAISSSWNRSFLTAAMRISLSFLFSRHSSRTLRLDARSAVIFFTWEFTSSSSCSSFFMSFSSSVFSRFRTLERAWISLILSALSTISRSSRFFSSADPGSAGGAFPGGPCSRAAGCGASSFFHG